MDTNEQDKPGLPHSGGNEGARGSHGQANRGASSEESTNAGADAQLPDEGKEDLRTDGDAQGGGGAASNSSRSRNL